MTTENHLTKYHVWLGYNSGLVWSANYDYNPKPIGNERFKYMGFTFGMTGYPKKMSTGRLLYKPLNNKATRRQKKLKKLSRSSQN